MFAIFYSHERNIFFLIYTYSCNYLIVEYGAGFWMNSLFSKNVIVLGYFNQHIKWNHYKKIYGFLQEYKVGVFSFMFRLNLYFMPLRLIVSD